MRGDGRGLSEAGLPRFSYATFDDACIETPIDSASLRRGLFDGLTLELPIRNVYYPDHGRDRTGDRARELHLGGGWAALGLARAQRPGDRHPEGALADPRGRVRRRSAMAC